VAQKPYCAISQTSGPGAGNRGSNITVEHNFG